MNGRSGVKYLLDPSAKFRIGLMKRVRGADGLKEATLGDENFATSLAIVQMTFNYGPFAFLQLVVQIKSDLGADFLTLIHL